MFCADVVLIESSNDGTCFIQTSSLDGEKNLKKRLRPKDFTVTSSKTGSKGKQYSFFKGKCECDEPNAELYDFSGNLTIEKKSYSLTAS